MKTPDNTIITPKTESHYQNSKLNRKTIWIISIPHERFDLICERARKWQDIIYPHSYDYLQFFIIIKKGHKKDNSFYLLNFFISGSLSNAHCSDCGVVGMIMYVMWHCLPFDRVIRQNVCVVWRKCIEKTIPGVMNSHKKWTRYFALNKFIDRSLQHNTTHNDMTSNPITTLFYDY